MENLAQKVVWIVNIPFGKFRYLLDKDEKFTSGTWLNVFADNIDSNDGLEYFIVVPWNVTSIISKKFGNVTYVVLPIAKRTNFFNKSSRNNWFELYSMIKPDIIQIWGSEFKHVQLALKFAPSVYIFYYVQGIVNSIFKYFDGGLRFWQLFTMLSFRDIVKFDLQIFRKLKLINQIKIEKLLLSRSDKIIIENMWSKAVISAVNPKAKFEKLLLPISASFLKTSWSYEACNKFTVLSIAGGFPYKGLHVLFHAVACLRIKYPNVEVKIPGIKEYDSLTLLEKVKLTGYQKFLYKLVRQLKIEDNVTFCGYMNSDEMARALKLSHVFVMPSFIENHSSSLIEALVVGTPCIAADVGGISELISHNINGLIYRPEEYELLASYIENLFEDDILCAKFSKHCSRFRTERDPRKIMKSLTEIYRNLPSP